MLRVPFDLLAWFVASLPTGLGIGVRRFVYRWAFKRLGSQLNIFESVNISGFGTIEIGNNATIRRHSNLYAIDGSLVIGDNLSANTNVYLDAGQGRIEIGNNCLIGPNCILRAADHNFEDPDRPITTQGHQSGVIVLEDDVWMGAQVVVTKNVRIGKGSVIGAQSVVTKDIPAFSIAYGVPARVMGSRKKHIDIV